MSDLMCYQNKAREFGLDLAAPYVTTLDNIDLDAIVKTFVPPTPPPVRKDGKPKKHYILPRIAFFGLYRYLSMTDHRHICKRLGFEYYENFGFGNQNEAECEVLASQLQTIIGKYTRLIVLGDVKPTPSFDFTWALFKKLKSNAEPELMQYNIPILFESELIKIHPDYPDIAMTTRWSV